MEKKHGPQKQHTHTYTDTHTLSHTCMHVPPASPASSSLTAQDDPSLFPVELLKQGCDSQVLLVPP